MWPVVIVELVAIHGETNPLCDMLHSTHMDYKQPHSQARAIFGCTASDEKLGRREPWNEATLTLLTHNKTPHVMLCQAIVIIASFASPTCFYSTFGCF